MPERETWVVGVSGGVDSAVLLDMLVESQTANLVVAHVDHVIQDDLIETIIIASTIVAFFSACAVFSWAQTRKK